MNSSPDIRQTHESAAAAAGTEPPAGGRTASGDNLHRAGTLSYTKSGMAKLFGWLLAGDVVFVLIDQLEPRVLPVLLKGHGAGDREIAFIVTMIPAFMTLFVNPFFSYCSDRTQTRWGRRIPYLALATPFVSLFLAITPFAPEIASYCSAYPSVARVMESMGASPVILVFGILVFVFQFFRNIIASVFFYLFRDVVPLGHLGRFMSLFRIFGALSTFALTYWLLSIIDTHAKPVFIGVAVLNLIGFLALCFNVKEGKYPPIVDKVTASPSKSRLIHAVRNYVSECFSSPIYWWMYAARTFVTAAVPVLGFTIFFPQYELGMGLEKSARYMAWPSLVWIVCAYPIGMLIDRWGIFRVFTHALWASVISYVGTFFLVQGPVTFLISAMCTGILYWAVMLTQLVYLQALVHPQRVGQLSSANEIIRSLFVMLVAGPFVGWFLHMLKDYRSTWHLPLIGSLEVGPYRFVNLILALLFFLALLCAKRSIAHWRKRGGPRAYMPPL